MNVEHASKHRCGSRPEVKAGKAVAAGEASDKRTRSFRRGIGVSMHVRGDRSQHGKPRPMSVRDAQRDLREEQARSSEVAERPVVADPQAGTPRPVTRVERRSLSSSVPDERTTGERLAFGLATSVMPKSSRARLYPSRRGKPMGRPRVRRGEACPKAGCGQFFATWPHVRFDEGESGNGAWSRILGHRQPKGSATDQANT